MAVDTSRLLSEVNKSVSTIKQTLEKKILNGVSANNPTNSDANAIKNLKKNIKINSGITGSSTKNVPDDVYTAFATMVSNDLADSKITKLATNDFERTNQIANALKAGIKNKKSTIHVGNTDYSIEYNIVAYGGVGNSSAHVRYKNNEGNQHIILTWTNVGTQQGTQALAEYCSLLKDLDLELWKNFFKKVLIVGASTSSWSVANYGAQIINSINDIKYAKSFLKGLGVSTEQLSASKFGQFIKDNAVGGDVIVSSAKLLKTLEKKQTALINAVNNNKKIESKLKDFAKTCNQLETKLGLKNSNFSIGEFTFFDIINKEKNITLSGTAGNDNISNWGEKVTIKAGVGDDSITNHYTGENVKIFGGAGKDSIYNLSTDVTISGGAGDDTIKNYCAYVAISGDANNDLIYSNRYLTTIDGGAGDDTIENDVGSIVLVNGGAGNDSICNSATWNSTTNDYENYSFVTIDGGAGNDFICNNATLNRNTDNYEGNSKVTIYGGTGNDTIKNYYGNYAIITGDAGKDSVYNSGENVTIDSGTGNDSIENFGDHVTINGGSGDDAIYNNDVYYAKINGGKGNDFISLDSWSFFNVIQYASGDGKDTIYGFDSTDTLHITKGNYKVSTKNNDVIVKVGTGKITLKNAVGKEISIQDSKGNVTTKTYGSSSANVAELFAENNFITNDNLSEIVENNLTPTSLEKIETNNFENLTQENNLITLTEK